MGFQVVSIVLNNGMRYDQAIVESGIITRIQGRTEIPFSEDEIADILVTHDRRALRTAK
jgi:hypothetical protein